MAKIKVEIEIKDYSSVTDTAAALQVAEITVWRWIKEHKIASVKIEGRTLVPNYAIEEIKTREPPGERGSRGNKAVKR